MVKVSLFAATLTVSALAWSPVKAAGVKGGQLMTRRGGFGGCRNCAGIVATSS